MRSKRATTPRGKRYSPSIHCLKKSCRSPDADDLRVALPQAKLDRMKADIEANITSSLEGAMQKVHERVAETLAHLIEKLNDFGVDAKTGKATGVFRDSTGDQPHRLGLDTTQSQPDGRP